MDTPKPRLSPEVLVPRLGEYLIERGLIDEKQLEEALEHQKKRLQEGKPCLVGQALVEMGVLDRAQLDEAVTEQIIKLRAALQDANRYLERRVQERTAELQEALRRLAELNQLKANFVSNVSHELRTPLTHLKGYLELLATESLGPLNEEQRQAVVTSQRAAMRLEEMINDLILFSMAARGTLSLELQPVDLRELLRRLMAPVRLKAERKNIHLVEDIVADLPPVRADADKLTWAINQLLDNAIKFTDAGGQVTLKVTVETSSMVQIQVSDTGIGIPQERMTEIFEPFHQLDGSSTRRYGGTGLGLSLVREIVEAHGSFVEVESAPGRGTTVRFYLVVEQKPSKAVL